ncbi:hypothetical protein KM043_004519 [Ampulex compressa]|nr:hypothetical protein KM043_004519 [Ampulex compressa]
MQKFATKTEEPVMGAWRQEEDEEKRRGESGRRREVTRSGRTVGSLGMERKEFKGGEEMDKRLRRTERRKKSGTSTASLKAVHWLIRERGQKPDLGRITTQRLDDEFVWPLRRVRERRGSVKRSGSNTPELGTRHFDQLVPGT